MGNYTESERNFILCLAQKTLILIKITGEKNSYFVPELLPTFRNKRLKPLLRADLEIEFLNSITMGTYIQVLNVLLRLWNYQNFILYKGFARFNVSTNTTLDVFIKNNMQIGFSMVQGSDLLWLRKLLEGVIDELPSEDSAFCQIIQPKPKTKIKKLLPSLKFSWFNWLKNE
eukprot:snap_masked-scaffold_74-processed-gene-0.49-mRNA-1 protein AED:1.00 eAED:1.00 QI:0/-1/0/0/-1/1/1/0/171